MTRRAFSCFIFGSVALLTFATSQAAVIEHASITRYTVDVAPPQTLQQAINSASQIREHGRVFHGHTQWRVKWSFRWNEQASGRCAITSVSTDLTTTMQLPELRQASAADRERFDRYLPRLKMHEDGHRDHGRAAAAEIDRRIGQLPAMSSCQRLNMIANNIGHQVVDDYTTRDRQYDDATEHGKTQGAWLAP